MGRYLNSSTSYVLYKGQTEQSYFVDKSQMLSELFPFLDSGNTHICITRPRRFGKTVMANMITAFLGKKQDSDSIVHMNDPSKGYLKIAHTAFYFLL